MKIQIAIEVDGLFEAIKELPFDEKIHQLMGLINDIEFHHIKKNERISKKRIKGLKHWFLSKLSWVEQIEKERKE